MGNVVDEELGFAHTSIELYLGNDMTEAVVMKIVDKYTKDDDSPCMNFEIRFRDVDGLHVVDKVLSEDSVHERKKRVGKSGGREGSGIVRQIRSSMGL